MKTTDERRLFKALAGAVRAAMKAKGVGLRELARDADVPVGTLHHWIGSTSDGTNNGRPRFAIVAAVTHVLAVDLSTIVAEWAFAGKVKGAKKVDASAYGYKGRKA